MEKENAYLIEFEDGSFEIIRSTTDTGACRQAKAEHEGIQSIVKLDKNQRRMKILL